MDATTTDLAQLYDRLDTLWAQYLTLLDAYQSAQQQLHKTLAAGFFSLAEANFRTSGRRYGRDHYDQRAVASCRIAVENGEGERVKVAVRRMEAEVPKGARDGEAVLSEQPDAESAAADSEKESPTHLPTPEATPEPESKEPSPKAPPPAEPEPKPQDPLRQFGILVPPALRAAQKSFAAAMHGEDDALTRAVNAAREMREVEVEIGRARKVARKVERAVESGN